MRKEEELVVEGLQSPRRVGMFRGEFQPLFTHHPAVGCYAGVCVRFPQPEEILIKTSLNPFSSRI